MRPVCLVFSPKHVHTQVIVAHVQRIAFLSSTLCLPAPAKEGFAYRQALLSPTSSGLGRRAILSGISSPGSASPFASVLDGGRGGSSHHQTHLSFLGAERAS